MASQLQYITVNAAGFIESMLRIQAPSQQTEVKIKGYISHKKLDTTASSALSANFIDPLPTLPICEHVKSKSSTQLEKKSDQRFRNSSVCIFKHESQLLFGPTDHAVLFFHGTVAMINVLEHVRQSFLDIC